MSRFIQNGAETPKKEPKPAKPVVKAGTKGFNYSSLSDAKKIISPNGGSR